MTLFELLYPSERKSAKARGIRNCHFHDMTIHELGVLNDLIHPDNRVLVVTNEYYDLSSSNKSLLELDYRIVYWHGDKNYFLSEPYNRDKEG